VHEIGLQIDHIQNLIWFRIGYVLKHGLEWEQRETRMAVESLGGRGFGEEALVGEAGGVEIRQQSELAGQPAWVASRT
jgi:hypothetical protein